jgi:uncharacterized repeat protein (TIGR03803 family)
MDSVRKGKTLALFLLCVAVVAAPAQTFTTLVNFGYGANGLSGQNIGPTLVQGTDGNLYGTRPSGGTDNGKGIVFRLTPKGVLSIVRIFSHNSDGRYPATLAVGPNGNLYGTTSGGGNTSGQCGTFGCGTIFVISQSGTLSTIHVFDFSDGFNPIGGLLLASDGNFYGTTAGGGLDGRGTIFRLTPAGKLTTVYSFTGGNDGALPGPLMQASNGKLFGPAADGATGSGTIFEITLDGTFTTIHNFFGQPDGFLPNGSLVQAKNGDLYGLTAGGGKDQDGSFFLLSPNGQTCQKLYDFTGGADGNEPLLGLLLGANGNFYGSDDEGGANGLGTLFEITPKGALTTLHSFDGTDGAQVFALMQATNGTFYGTTTFEGSNSKCMDAFGCGTAFSLSTGLGPFVAAVPPSRGIGAKVILLGQGFTGTTSVTFNGVSAAFTLNSDTEITATVPTGAKTGYVQVKTPTGTLSTIVVFVVA